MIYYNRIIQRLIKIIGENEEKTILIVNEKRIHLDQ